MDDALRAAYQRSLEDRSALNAECPAPEVLLAVGTGTLPEAERLAILNHLGGCRFCQADLALLRSAAEAAEAAGRGERGVADARGSAPARTSAVAAATSSRSTRHRTAWIAAAASVALLLGGLAVWRAASPVTEPDTMRGAPNAVHLLEPAANAPVHPPVRLVWAEVSGALRYELEVLGLDGTAVYTATTQDTAFVLPDVSALVPDTDYLWWVRAVRADGTDASLARRLRIATP